MNTVKIIATEYDSNGNVVHREEAPERKRCRYCGRTLSVFEMDALALGVDHEQSCLFNTTRRNCNTCKHRLDAPDRFCIKHKTYVDPLSGIRITSDQCPDWQMASKNDIESRIRRVNRGDVVSHGGYDVFFRGKYYSTYDDK